MDILLLLPYSVSQINRIGSQSWHAPRGQPMSITRAAAGTRPDRRMHKLTELSEIDRGPTGVLVQYIDI